MSAAVPRMVAPFAGELRLILVGGALFETVTVWPLEVVLFPTVSKATAVIACWPSATEAEFQLMLQGALVAVPTLFPSTRKLTWSTAVLSLAFALRTIEPLTVAPSAGAVIETVGGVVSSVMSWLWT